jgi:hypothetical protein
MSYDVYTYTHALSIPKYEYSSRVTTYKYYIFELNIPYKLMFFRDQLELPLLLIKILRTNLVIGRRYTV